MDYVILVHLDDTFFGIEEKLLAHKRGSLHRAVSVCLFDNEGRWLLQKRAEGKYHSPGKWANSCCSHPRLGEKTIDAAERRVYEELGIQVKLTPKGFFIYREEVGKELVEHELDYVFTGIVTNSNIPCNPDEVSEVAFFSADEIAKKLKEEPHFFASWFPHVFEFIYRTNSIPSHDLT